jgi:hypothetical protein
MKPKKKNFARFWWVLILLTICSLCVGPGSAIVKNTPYITINPVGDHAIGDIITLSGTTNFPVNTTLWIQAGPKEFTKYPPHYIGERVQVVQGISSNLWSIQINTSTFAIDEYSVLVSPLIQGPIVFGQTRFSMISRPVSTVLTMAATQTPGNRFISIDPVPDHFSGESFTITGTTNLSAGEQILVDIYSPDHMSGPKGTFSSGSVGTVTVRNESGGKNSWSFTVGPSDLEPDKYTVVATSYGPERGDSRVFYILERSLKNNSLQESDPDNSESASPVTRPAPVPPVIPACALFVVGIIVAIAGHRG